MPFDQIDWRKSVRVRGVKYAMTDTGGAGEPVILAHGWPDDRSVWRYQIAALHDAGYRVIAIDWIGHGESEVPKDVKRYSVPEVSADLIAIMDFLQIPKAHLIAHDYGATVCWEFAARHSDRLLSFSALSVGPSIEVLGDILRGNLLRYHWLVLHGLERLSLRYYLTKDARRFRKTFKTHKDAEKILKKLRERKDLTFWTIWERANPAPAVVLRHLLKGRYLKIDVRTLGIFGLQETMMTEGQMARAGRWVASAWQYETVDADHWMQLEKPEQINQILLKWLKN